MLWTEAVVHTTTQGIEPVAGLLLMNGINGYAVQDSQDFIDFLEGKEAFFDYIEDDLLKLKECETKVTFYVADNTQGYETLVAVKKALDNLKQSDNDGVFGTLELESDAKIEEQDWANNWKKYFKPFAVGNTLCIKPSWESLPEELSGRTVIEIDPSSSFGTGSHTTTRLCLEMIEKYLPGFKKPFVLDMGCGSGILGIASVKLGAEFVNAVDVDENSVRIAKENFEFNNIDKCKYKVCCGNVINNQNFFDDVVSTKYDFITANIVADIIIWMAPMFKKCLAKDGVLVVSGIILSRASEVTDALIKAGFEIRETVEDNEWAAVVLCHGSL